ncbi:MAG TPA: protein phosphatase 2C domain-containing protein [Bacillales bacterium]|nr:protein phosphatase 2C domain-containing protein [Bacillales bacterium]
MKIESFTRKGINPFNEDRLVANHSAAVFGVLDGCSSIEKFRGQNGETGGYLAANILGNELEKITASESMIDAVKSANLKIEQRMIEEKIDIGSKDKRWGTVFAVVKIFEHSVEYIQIGDCMAFAVYRSGEIRPLTISQVSHLEIRSLLKWKEAIERGYTSPQELSKYTAPIVRENRKKSNTYDGYGVLNGEPEALQLVEYGKINRTELKDIVLISDGLVWPEKDPIQSVDWGKSVNSILEKGLESYAESILQIENEDPDCQTYIRLKKSDDKTGLVLTF